MKSTRLALALAIGSSLGLAACDSEQEVLVEESPDAMAGMDISNGRFVLPAVSGNPAAIYFDVDYSGSKAAMIRRVDVAGAASAQIHETVDVDGAATMQEVYQMGIPQGETFKFEPGGRHIMAMGVGEEVSEGDIVEVTLTFVGGKKASFPAEVQGAGEER